MKSPGKLSLQNEIWETLFIKRVHQPPKNSIKEIQKRDLGTPIFSWDIFRGITLVA